MIGVPFKTLIINMPPRFQALDDKTPLGAGIWLLPFTVMSPVCLIISIVVASKARVLLTGLLLADDICHPVGVTLLCTLRQLYTFFYCNSVNQVLYVLHFYFNITYLCDVPSFPCTISP